MLISIEGIDGSGKSTLAGLLVQRLNDQGVSSVAIPPRGTMFSDTCEAIRAITHSVESNLTDHAELFLYLARLSHRVEEAIRPAIDVGSLVIVDRYTHSILALSHFYRGLDRAFVETILREVTHGYEPDGTILCDLDPLVAKEREAIRGRPSTRKEALGLSFQNTVSNGLREMAAEDPNRWHVIPVEPLSPEEVVDSALRFVRTLSS